MKYYGLIVERKEIANKESAPVPEGYINFKEVMESIRAAQRPGRLWNEGPMLETGDLEKERMRAVARADDRRLGGRG